MDSAAINMNGFHMECAEQAFTQEAKDSLTEKLKDGKQVGHCTLRDLIYSDLDQRFEFCAIEIANCLMDPTKIEAYKEGLIDRYLDSKPELVEEEAANERELEEDFREWDAANE